MDRGLGKKKLLLSPRSVTYGGEKRRCVLVEMDKVVVVRNTFYHNVALRLGWVSGSKPKDIFQLADRVFRRGDGMAERPVVLVEVVVVSPGLGAVAKEVDLL